MTPDRQAKASRRAKTFIRAWRKHRDMNLEQAVERLELEVSYPYSLAQLSRVERDRLFAGPARGPGDDLSLRAGRPDHARPGGGRSHLVDLGPAAAGSAPAIGRDRPNAEKGWIIRAQSNARISP